VAWLSAIKTISGAPITSVVQQATLSLFLCCLLGQDSHQSCHDVQDVNDDSDPDSDEAQAQAGATPANWISGQVQSDRVRYPSVSGSSIPVSAAGTPFLSPSSLCCAQRATLTFFATLHPQL
jgi:hypothetical protein